MAAAKALCLICKLVMGFGQQPYWFKAYFFMAVRLGLEITPPQSR